MPGENLLISACLEELLKFKSPRDEKKVLCITIENAFGQTPPQKHHQ